MMNEKNQLIAYLSKQKKWKIEFNQRYWKISLPWNLVEPIRKQVEAQLGQALKHRGEAHITVITPPEWVYVAQNKKIHKKSAPHYLKGSIQWVCIGRYQDKTNPHLATYFIVIEAPFLKKWRKKYWGLNEEQFPYHPHVTLGFTERDLHQQDGAIKNSQSCDPRFNL